MKNKATSTKEASVNKDQLYKTFLITSFLEKIEKEKQEKEVLLDIFKNKVKAAVQEYSKKAV